MQINSVGIDLGKTTFHLVALGEAGKALVRTKFNQRQLLTYTANMPTAMANKLARIAWAVLSSGEDYQPASNLVTAS